MPLRLQSRNVLGHVAHVRIIAAVPCYPDISGKYCCFYVLYRLPERMMPDKPVWYDRLDEAVALLTALPSPWIDRQTLESILGIGRRRAQQILRPLVRHTIGKNGLAAKEDVVAYLQRLGAGDSAGLERRRRQRLHALIAGWRKDAQQQPKVFIEAPDSIVNQQLENLPSGVRLAPGRIVIEDFTTPDEAKQKLLALIMAMGNDPDEFDRCIALETRRDSKRS